MTEFMFWIIIILVWFFIYLTMLFQLHRYKETVNNELRKDVQRCDPDLLKILELHLPGGRGGGRQKVPYTV
jgi:hypothetical protein